jgi:hypothetical protein
LNRWEAAQAMKINRAIYQKRKNRDKEECHVLVDGVDVTKICLEADTTLSYAICVVPNDAVDTGDDFRRYKMKNRKIDLDFKRGRVEITFTAVGTKEV